MRYDPSMLDLVMIPAFGCDHRLYDEVAAGLSNLVRPRTIVVDAGDFQACVAQILAAAPQRFVILGTSFGGRAALETALAAPERAEGLVVIGAGAGPAADPVAGRRRARRLREGEMEDVLAEMGAMISHLPGPRGALARDLFIAMGRDMGAERMARQADALAARGDMRSRLAGLAYPALMLWGALDQFSSPGEGRGLAAALPAGHYGELADCGHFPTLERPAETIAALRRWLVAVDLA